MIETENHHLPEYNEITNSSQNHQWIYKPLGKKLLGNGIFP